MPSRDIPDPCMRAYFRRAWACLLAGAWLLVAVEARAELPRPGIYRANGSQAPAGSQALERLIVAVDPGEEAVKVWRPGSTPAQAQGQPCAAYGARYESPAASVLTEGTLGWGDFCEAEIDVDPSSVLLKIPPSSSSPDTTVVDAKLAEARPYVDIVRLPRQAYFYQAPDASKKTAAYVVADDYVAVLQKAADWFLVDFFGRASETRGWIRREDLVHGHWVEQSAKTPQYSFAVACQHEAGSDRITVDALEIKDRSSGQRTQIFYDLNGVEEMGQCEDVVALGDANFDGHPDLVIAAGNAALAGTPNNSVTFYLFHPERQRFEVHAGLSALTQPQIDPVKREIRAGYTSGAMEHGSERYHFAGGRLILIESEVEKCGDDDLCDVTTRRLVRGAYVVTKTKRHVPF